MVTDKGWFEKPTEESLAKREIVTKYFSAWSKIMLSKSKSVLSYVDLFSGPGRYEDGTPSTPLLILEKAINDAGLRSRLMIAFNDADPNLSNSLDNAINSFEGINTLAYRPKVNNIKIAGDIVKSFEKASNPTLFFLDPWGYKGLTLKLIGSAVKQWGCDCIFFFNYNRIKMGIANKIVLEHMNELFGEEGMRQLNNRLNCKVNAQEKENIIMSEITDGLRKIGGKFIIFFCFKNIKGTKTSHYIIFVSKNKIAYKIMKEIMAQMSTLKEQGVGTFTFCALEKKQLRLFEYSKPLDDLKETLLKDLSGRSMTVEEIFYDHSIDTPYTLKNYKDVLRTLEEEGKIKIVLPKGRFKRKKGTLPDDLIIKFPERVD
ncbi:MAG: three-Cys-motif partner protein TcmP [Candidatus Eremiobacteraeota bacterium]|nr:three-Cys-motif partner protein TcmP [Candidatus Eremiobacteraeota bacterium]